MSINYRRARNLRRFVLATVMLVALPGGAAWTAGDLSGRYAILREADKDTGCMLTLRPGAKAQLAPACRDNGIVIFDPIGWGQDRGKMVLTARKGHKAHFEKGPDGIWRRDQQEGKALALKPL